MAKVKSIRKPLKAVPKGTKKATFNIRQLLPIIIIVGLFILIPIFIFFANNKISLNSKAAAIITCQSEKSQWDYLEKQYIDARTQQKACENSGLAYTCSSDKKNIIDNNVNKLDKARKAASSAYLKCIEDNNNTHTPKPVAYDCGGNDHTFYEILPDGACYVCGPKQTGRPTTRVDASNCLGPTSPVAPTATSGNTGGNNGSGSNKGSTGSPASKVTTTACTTDQQCRTRYSNNNYYCNNKVANTASNYGKCIFFDCRITDTDHRSPHMSCASGTYCNKSDGQCTGPSVPDCSALGGRCGSACASNEKEVDQYKGVCWSNTATVCCIPNSANNTSGSGNGSSGGSYSGGGGGGAGSRVE